MKKIKSLLLLLGATFFCCAFSFSQTDNHTPIDHQCEACLDSVENQSTQGMVECERKAQAAWDAELNKYYKLLIPVLDKGEQSKLKLAQKSWLSYKKAELAFYELAYTNEGGTMWQIFAASRETEIVKTRALELLSYYNLLTYQE